MRRRRRSRIANDNAIPWMRQTLEVAQSSDALIVAGLAAFIGLSVARSSPFRSSVRECSLSPRRANFPPRFCHPDECPAGSNKVRHTLLTELLCERFANKPIARGWRWRDFRRGENPGPRIRFSTASHRAFCRGRPIGPRTRTCAVNGCDRRVSSMHLKPCVIFSPPVSLRSTSALAACSASISARCWRRSSPLCKGVARCFIRAGAAHAGWRCRGTFTCWAIRRTIGSSRRPPSSFITADRAPRTPPAARGAFGGAALCGRSVLLGRAAAIARRRPTDRERPALQRRSTRARHRCGKLTADARASVPSWGRRCEPKMASPAAVEIIHALTQR